MGCLLTKKCSSETVRRETIGKKVTLSGKGLFTGENIKIELCPSDANCGVMFQRMNMKEQIMIPASIESVKDTPRCTIIGNECATIQTVEHLLSAIHALGIDNILIKVYGPEIPAVDGSSFAFVDILEQGGLVEQAEEKTIYRITKPVSWAEKDTFIVAIPSDVYRVNYTLHYPHSAYLRSQYYSFTLSPDGYKNEIAPSRTFSLYEEIEPLLNRQLIKGGGLDNAIIIKNDNT